MIDGPIEYSEEQKTSLVEDLIIIASKNLEDLYRPGEEPVDGCCPVISCAFPNLRVRILTVHSGPTSSHFTVAHSSPKAHTRLPPERIPYLSALVE